MKLISEHLIPRVRVLAAAFAVVGLPATAWADIEFRQKVLEMTPPADVDEEIVAEFAFSNTGNTPVFIRKFNCACAGLNSELEGNKQRYEPGEEGVLRTRFKPGIFTGTISKSVVLWMENDPEDAPSHTVTLKVVLPEVVVLELRNLVWRQGEAPSPKTIRVSVRQDQPVNPVKLSLSTENFRQRMRTLEEGKLYDIDVSPVNTGIIGLAVLKIETDCPLPRHRNQMAFVSVLRP